MDCPLCGEFMGPRDRGQYRGIPGDKDMPNDWVACHISCARLNQEKGAPITVRWFPLKS